MRKFAGVLVAAALIVPAGIIAAAPGGAAAAKPTCTKLTGVATFKPALPMIGKTNKVKPTITITGAKLTGCTGGGVTGGTVKSTLKFGVASNCSDLLGGKSTKTTGTVGVTWSNKKTSAANVTLVGVTGNATQQTVAGPVTTGLFKGSKISATTQFTPANGGCTKSDLSKVTFTLKKGAKLTVK
jgi:hypothetical protein